MKNLYNLLRRRGYTPTKFAEDMNVTLSTVSYWNKGKRTPSLDKFQKMCLILELDAEESMELLNHLNIIAEMED